MRKVSRVSRVSRVSGVSGVRGVIDSLRAAQIKRLKGRWSNLSPFLHIFSI